MTIRTLTIKNEISELRKLPGFTDDIFSLCHIDGKTALFIRTGLDEALTNCVMYAYGEPGAGEIEITADICGDAISFTLKDSGEAFNPLKKETEMSDEIKVGGLGIMMMKESFDNVLYDRQDGHNILKLTKTI